MAQVAFCALGRGGYKPEPVRAPKGQHMKAQAVRPGSSRRRAIKPQRGGRSHRRSAPAETPSRCRPVGAWVMGCVSPGPYGPGFRLGPRWGRRALEGCSRLMAWWWTRSRDGRPRRRPMHSLDRRPRRVGSKRPNWWHPAWCATRTSLRARGRAFGAWFSH